MKYVKPLNEIESETLHHMHRAHPSRRARMRAHCILLSHQRDTLPHIARFYQVSRRRVSVWLDRWHTWGLVGLYDRPRSGRPSTLTAEEQQKVPHYLQETPKDVKRIVAAMAQETRKRVSTKTMKRSLKKNAIFGNASRSHQRNLLTQTSTGGAHT